VNGSRRRECPLNEQAVGWALHALEPDEEMAVLLHLPQCESCQTAVADAEEVLGGLGASVEQVEPPAPLRDALLARAAETPQRSRPPRAPVAPDPGTSSAAAEPRHRVSSDRPGTDRPRESRPVLAGPRSDEAGRSWFSLRGRRLVAASLVLAGVLTVGGLAARTAQLEQQRDAETAQAQGIADLFAQLARPGVRHALLSAPDGSTVAALLVADGQRQLFTVGLPANATDNTYVLWGMRDGAAAQPIGTFDIAAADPGVRTVGSGSETDRYSGYAISIEPGRTAPASPSAVVATGEVQT
jgi:hypothetical protein